MDYQRYAFELLTNSDLRGLTFTCPPSTVCAYPSSTPETCTVSGADVLDNLHIGCISHGAWAGIVIGITLIYRIPAYRPHLQASPTWGTQPQPSLHGALPYPYHLPTCITITPPADSFATYTVVPPAPTARTTY
ncbi:hypothetical protein DFH08DRAFT_977762 [Mycena albidolilacea]|uniref:Uncharacterized protein n=1 Tax=Mycena albidolilacea TaxID=1033008 RepID=A0AAD6YZZ8_9AGAR|nr:hypothetical protein DFH08DRAFT_977762 [Mycena albidolilacea]